MVEGTSDQIDPASQVDKNSFVFPLQPTSRLLLHTKEVSFQGGEQEVASWTSIEYNKCNQCINHK